MLAGVVVLHTRSQQRVVLVLSEAVLVIDERATALQIADYDYEHEHEHEKAPPGRIAPLA